MVGDKFGHLEHRHLLLAAKDSFQLFVCIDHAFVKCILQIQFLDVFPNLFRHFRTRQWIGADDCGQYG